MWLSNEHFELTNLAPWSFSLFLAVSELAHTTLASFFFVRQVNQIFRSSNIQMFPEAAIPV